MTATVILNACLELLEDFVYVPQPVVMWPGIQTDPPDEGFWLEPKLFPNENMDPAWDDDACARVRGFFQIKVYYRVRPDAGVIQPMQLADALIAHYPKGTVLGPVRVRKKPYQSPYIDEDASRSFIPVTVPYQGSM